MLAAESQDFTLSESPASDTAPRTLSAKSPSREQDLKNEALEEALYRHKNAAVRSLASFPIDVTQPNAVGVQHLIHRPYGH